MKNEIISLKAENQELSMSLSHGTVKPGHRPEKEPEWVKWSYLQKEKKKTT